MFPLRFLDAPVSGRTKLVCPASRQENPLIGILGRFPVFRAIRQSDILMTTRKVMRMSDFRFTKNGPVIRSNDAAGCKSFVKHLNPYK
jgi:hypothetical protein